jgi:hypothetical protein
MRRGRNLTMLRKIKISLVVLTLGCVLIGCGRATTIWVLKSDEMVPLSKGETFVVPYDGCYYSLQAETRIMDAKRIEANLK